MLFILSGYCFYALGIYPDFMGFFHKKFFERWLFRTLHLFGIAYVGLLAVLGQYCPLAILESALRARYNSELTYSGSFTPLDSKHLTGFIIHYIEKLVYPDVNLLIIVIPTVIIAFFTILVFILRPPKKIKEFLRKTNIVLSVLTIMIFVLGCREQKYYIKTMQAIQNSRLQINFNNYQGSLLAGASKIDITPPIGTPLAGYGARRDKPSIGIYDRLYARALILSDGEDTVIIVGCDLLAISNDIYDAVLGKIEEKIPSLGREDLLISATHTHSATGSLGKRFLEKFATGHFDEEIFKFTTENIAKAIISAYQNLAPAKIGFNRGDIKGISKNRMNDAGPIDPELGVIRIEDLDGNPIAYVINFACHPTILGRENLYISGDYPGWLQKEIEKNYKSAIAIFTQGAGGDIAPKLEGSFTSKIEEVKEMARILAHKVFEINEKIITESKVEIISLGSKIYLPSAQIRLGRFKIPSFIGNIFLDEQTFKNIILINDIPLISFPGDLSSEIGLEFKKIAKNLGYNLLIITLANDYIGYVIPEKYYWTEKEGFMSFNGPEMDSYWKDIVNEFIEVLEEYEK